LNGLQRDQEMEHGRELGRSFASLRTSRERGTEASGRLARSSCPEDAALELQSYITRARRPNA
jgi:hypothetical protein